MRPPLDPTVEAEYLDRLLAALCHGAPTHYHVTPESIRGKSRARWFSYYRQAAYWRLMDQGWSAVAAGRALERDESTVREGAAKFARLLKHTGSYGERTRAWAASLPTMEAA